MRKIKNLLFPFVSSKQKTRISNFPTLPNPCHIGDFETDPIRFRYDAYMEEFRSLWQEVQQTLNIQERTLNYIVILWAGILAAFSTLSRDTLTQLSSFIISLPVIFLFLSVLFIVFVLSYVEHDIQNGHIGLYIQTELAPKIETIAESRVSTDEPLYQSKVIFFGWDKFRSKKQFRFPNDIFNFLASGFRYLFVASPTITSTLIFAYIKITNATPITLYEYILLSILTLGWIMIIWGLIRAAKIYTSWPDN